MIVILKISDMETPKNGELVSDNLLALNYAIKISGVKMGLKVRNILERATYNICTSLAVKSIIAVH